MLPTLAGRLVLAAAALAAFAAPLARGQAQSDNPRPAFDVASVKPSQSTDYWDSVAPMKNGRFSARHVTAKLLLGIAYRIDATRISGGPQWLDSDRFDVEAKCDGQPPDKDLALMLQSLLADRFHLKAHSETKVVSTYALVVVHGGPKIQPVEHRDCPADGKPAAGYTGVRFAGRGLTAEYVSIANLARYLAGMSGTSVSDETGLTGAYDFTLAWIRDAEESAGAPGGPAPAERGGTSMDWIFSALPQQLGLRLEPRKTSAEMLVVDGIDKPSAN